jgi:hypothetical protein
MNTLTRLAVALLVGIVTAAVVAVGLAAGLQSRIEFSLLVGLPTGVFAGLTALFATYAHLWGRGATPSVSTSTSAAGAPVRPGRVRVARAGVAAAVGFGLVGAVGLGLYLLAGVSTGLSVLILGSPIGALIAAALAYLVGRPTKASGDRTRSSDTR